MISISYFLEKIKDVRPEDYLSAFPMIVALCLKSFFKKKYVGAWLICEEPAEARDNGYHFFKYMCEKQPQQKCYYAIKSSSVDAKKVQVLGDTLEYGSIQHWLAYFLCEYNISSQKGGKPNAAMCAFMEMNGVFKPKNVFLQHGVTINNVKWLHSDNCRICKLITATVDETKFIKDNFGYQQNNIVFTGFSRFDALHNIQINKNQIIIMPTWRYWFNLKSKMNENINNNFGESEYLKKWIELLDDPLLGEMIKEKKLTVFFYLHRNLQRFSDFFSNLKNPVKIATWEKYDIQDLLKSSAVMITDYSSVFFDMVYMKKPVIFYQFDEEKYRKYQYEKGYFDYHNNCFGNCFIKSQDVIKELVRLAESNFEVDKKFNSEHNRIFLYYDEDNSKRIYEQLCFH